MLKNIAGTLIMALVFYAGMTGLKSCIQNQTVHLKEDIRVQEMLILSLRIIDKQTDISHSMATLVREGKTDSLVRDVMRQQKDINCLIDSLRKK